MLGQPQWRVRKVMSYHKCNNYVERNGKDLSGLTSRSTWIFKELKQNRKTVKLLGYVSKTLIHIKQK